MFTENSQWNSIAVVGVGLIGGSIALASRKFGVCTEVVGVGRNIDRLHEAQRLGIVDRVTTSLDQIGSVDLVVVCTPVDRIVQDVSVFLDSTPDATLVTDAGSVKAKICEQIQSRDSANRFVGSHPLAGSHRSGFENANPELFVRRKCVVTPSDQSISENVAAIQTFWKKLGMDVRSMTPSEHDRMLAMTSHLPHMAASAVASLVSGESLDFAATGFRDTTRVAAGEPQLWSAIFSENTTEVVAATDALIDQLKKHRDALVDGNTEDLIDLLTIAQANRQEFDERHKQEAT